MAILKLCAVHDFKAELYMRPYAAQTLGLAERAFIDEVNRSDESNPMFKHPSDFALFYLGDFDESSGVVEPLNPPRLITNASSVIKEINHGN